MIVKLSDITDLQSGIYEKPHILADLLYLQAVDFTPFGGFDTSVRPQLKLNSKTEKHLLKEDDILFAAKGVNNFAVVYRPSFGQAVASSSFIVIRLKEQFNSSIYPEYLAWILNHAKKLKLFQQQQLGTTIPSISIRQLSDLEIEIPSLKTQKTILKITELRNREIALKQRIEQLREQQFEHLLINITQNKIIING